MDRKYASFNCGTFLKVHIFSGLTLVANSWRDHICKRPSFDEYHDGSPSVAFSFMPAVLSVFEQGSNPPLEFLEKGKPSRGGKYSHENFLKCCRSLKMDNYIQHHIISSAIITLVCVVIVKPLKIMSFVFLASLLFSSVTLQNQQRLHHPTEDSAVEKHPLVHL